MATQATDKVFKAKVQTLLGETGKKADHAVRFRDMAGLDDAVAATKAKAEAAAAAIGETTFDISELRERVDVSEQEVQQAAAAAANALSAANAAAAYTDQQVEAAKDSMAVDYTAAQTAVQDALEAVTHAQDAQAAAEGVFSTVQTLSGEAEASRLAAEAAQVSAETHVQNAVLARNDAQSARDAAQAARDGAESVFSTVQTLSGEAEASRLAAEAAQAAAATARTQAQTAAANADGSASAAAGSASTASTSATDAGDSATAAAASVVAANSAKSDAHGFADAASTSATSASTSASNASTSAAAAATAKTAAQTARSGAESARDTAVTARNDAQGAASTATTQAGISTTAATSAEDSATAASTSATAASSSATNAAQSASAAASAKTAAQTARSGAESAQETAVTAKNDAQDAASTATTQAGIATSAATNAGDSATAASTSATAAASHATDAAQSASAAASAKTAAQTARSGAESAQETAVTAKNDAQDAASTATTQASLSATSATDSEDSATAAATSAAAASSSATSAEQSAVAAETARTQAQTARSGAEVARDAAVTAKNDAQGSASTATTKAGIATTATNQAIIALNSTTILSGRPLADLASFGSSKAGLPETYSAFTGLTYGVDAGGPYVRRPAANAGNAVFLRALAPTSNTDAAYRVTAKVRAIGVSIPLQAVARWIGADGTSIAAGNYTSTNLTLGANEIGTITFVLGRAAGGLVTQTGGTLTDWTNSTGIRFGVRNSAAVSGGSFDLLELKVEDMTEADQASRQATAAASSASAASTSASQAASVATAAAQSAAAAESAKTAAQTARSGAESARDTAVTARNDAQGAASTATTQAGISTTAATSAEDSATAASTSATAASSSASNAAQSASTATTQANNASTAAGQASTSAAQAASSATDAQGSASTAATQAGVATSAATNAGDSATAASTSAAAAASSATDAAQSASASQTAKLAAETARGQAQSYRDDASIAATNAGNSAALATTQAGVSAAAASDAAGIVAAVFPADFSAAGRYWTHAIAGYPASRPDRGAPVTFPDDSTWGRVARLSAPITGNQHFAPKSYLQNSAGRRYRLTVEAVHVGAFAGGSENAIYLLFRKFNGAYAATGDLVAGSLMFTAPDTVTTKSIEVTAPGGADPYILPFAYVNALKFGGSGPAILFRSIKIEDITESSAANLSATSSSQSASSASGYADEASAYASAANTARLAAEAAQSGANSASAAATLARDDAVVAANTAEGAAASAQSSVTLASEIVSSEGGGVLDDAFLASSSWVRSPATGSQTFGENTAHPIGRDWTMTVTAETAEGLYVRSTSAIWTGQKSAPAFVVEIDFSLASGTLSGAGVQVQWNDGAARLLNLPLSSMTSSDMLIGVQTARAVFVRPSSYVGPLSFMHVQIFANSAAFGAMAAKVLTIHRVKIRPATDEELGSGQVAAAVQAKLNTNYFTRAQTNQAIASFDMSLNTSFSQLSSSVSTQATSIADLEAGATAGYLIKAQAGGAVSLLQLIAADGSGGAPTSVARIAATDILLDGSVAASQLVVTDLSGNMCPDRPWSMGDWAGWSAQSGIDIRKKGFSTTNVAKKMPTAYAARWANVDGASPFAQSIQVNVSAGNTYALQVRTAVASQGTLGRRAQIGLRWLDQNGALISGSYAYTTRTATNTYEVSDTLTATAPEGASYATVWMRSWCVAGTDDGDLYIAAPVLTRKSDGAILLKDGTVTAELVNTDSFYSAGLAVFGGSLQSENFDESTGAGWQIKKSGQMIMPDASISRAKIGDHEIYAAYYFTSVDVPVPTSNSYASPVLVMSETITDFEGGGFLATFSAYSDASYAADAFGTVFMVINGVEVDRQSYGVRTASGQTYSIIPVIVSGVYDGGAEVTIDVYAYNRSHNSDTNPHAHYTLTGVSLTISGAQR